MASKFKPGDMVRLKRHWPAMEVVAQVPLVATDGPRYQCTWRTGQGTDSGTFEERLLAFAAPQTQLASAEALKQAQHCLRLSEQFSVSAERALMVRVVKGQGADAEDADRFELAPVVPAVVCAAFAVELAFKAMLLIDQLQQPRGHDLVALFDKLPVASQQAVKQAVQAPSYPRSASRTMFFREALDDIKTVFKDWRYAYEKPDMSAGVTFIQELARASQAIAKGMTAPQPLAPSGGA
jgi:uncharacterized protein YodC (DUF2158 family)